MIHPDTELRFINDSIGFGIFATKKIPQGSISWALDPLDRLLYPAEFKEMNKYAQEVLYKYCYRNRDGNYVLCWDISRYMNHSSKPNCLSTAYDFEVAIRDILPGEQILCNYASLNLEEPFEYVEGTSTDIHVLYPDESLRLFVEWDKTIQKAIAHFDGVSQPLIDLLPPDTLKLIRLSIEGKATLASSKENYFDSRKSKSVGGYFNA